MAIRVLIINRQLAFSVALKQALERTGAFDVHPFTTADAGIEYLQGHPQDVVLLDFTSVAPNGANVVDGLRGIQPGIPIVASPRQSADITRLLRLQESLDPPFSARDVIPLLNQATDAARRGSEQTRNFSDSVPDSSNAVTSERQPQAPSESPAPPPPLETRLRPGEIGEEQLRPYMYSTDLFKQRQEEEAARPGEIREEDLPAPSTDVFREQAASSEPAESPERPSRRAGEYGTEDLQPPTTDVFREEGGSQDSIPPLERPTRRRTGSISSSPLPTTDVFRGQPPSDPASEGMGEISEQELLNRVMNRDDSEEADESPRRSSRPGEIGEEQLRGYRIDTDIFKEDAGNTSAISSDDAAAMWEQLTRDEMSAQPDAPPSTGEAFEFESYDNEGETPTPPSVTDILLERAQSMEVDLPPEEQPIPPPLSPTDVLLARAQEMELDVEPESSEPNMWDFPDEGEYTSPLSERQPEAVERSRKPTDRLPEQERLTPEDFLAQQYEVENLTQGSITDEVAAAYAIPFNETIEIPESQSPDEGDGDDGFEPPISPEDLVSSWGVEISEEQTPSPDDSGTMILSDVDEDAAEAGVRQLEAIADEIRRTREAQKIDTSVMRASVDETFEKLAAEEPPPPDVLDDDGGTIGDIYTGITDPSFRSVLNYLRNDDEIEPSEESLGMSSDEQPSITKSEIDEIFSAVRDVQEAENEFDFDDAEAVEESTPAHLILETALDDSTPADSFSLKDLIASIERQLEQHKANVRPLPSWREEAPLREDLFVREPDFLQDVIDEVDALPEIEEEPDTFGDATTISGGEPVVAQNMETEWLPTVEETPSAVPESDWSLEESEVIAETDSYAGPFENADEIDALPRIEGEEPEFNTEFERLATFDFDEPDSSEFTPPMGMPSIQDPYVAQIALSLTQISLEEVAAAVLTRENEVMAFAGRMGRDDIEEIRAAINGQWDQESDQPNIRFVTLSTSGRDYMLYSRRTLNDLTLSLVFTSATPLRDIRKQSKRLIEALMNVPDPSPENGDMSEESRDALTALSSDVRGVYTYVWLLRDADQRLSDVVARAIETGMRVQLQERAWNVMNLQVRDDLVYLQADVPGEAPPYEIVRDLKRRAAEIARKQNPAFGKSELWADGYLILSAGRDLDEDEIQQYIQFERMT